VNHHISVEEKQMTAMQELQDGVQKIFFRAGGEWCYLWTPEAFRRDRPLPVVIHHHGAEGYVTEHSADWLEEDYKVGLLTAVMGAAGGCAVAGSHACGDHSGNPGAVAANAALFEALAQTPGIDSKRVGLMGGGLGGALIWNSVLGPLAGRVKAVAVLQSVASLEAFIRAQRHKWMVLAAYGLAADTPDDEAVRAVAPHDPLPFLRQLPYGTPLPRTAIYHGADDDDVFPETHAVPLERALKKAGADVTFELFPNVGHAVYMMGAPIQLRLAAFFSSSFMG
jgi:dipeptidyl aminopeptidase/acylaminoacyl peptidase